MTGFDGFWLTVWGLFSVLYLVGWWRLRRQGARGLANGWRLLLAVSALAAGFFAFLPETTEQAHRSFWMHMVEHEILIEVTPILLWLARPVPFWLWSLPARRRRSIALRVLGPASRWRQRLQPWTRPRWVVPLYLIVVTLWHVPPMVDAAMTSMWWHSIERASLLFSALLFWWLVLAAFPRWHTRGRSARMPLYVVAAYVQNQLLGLSITLARRPIYRFYEETTSPWGLPPLVDQTFGGATMWIPGELIYVMVMMGLLVRLLDEPRPYRGVYQAYS